MTPAELAGLGLTDLRRTVWLLEQADAVLPLARAELARREQLAHTANMAL
jgi:hypothetical protein